MAHLQPHCATLPELPTCSSSCKQTSRHFNKYQDILGVFLRELTGNGTPKDTCFSKKTIDLLKSLIFLLQTPISALESRMTSFHVMSLSVSVLSLTLSVGMVILLSMSTIDYHQTWKEIYGRRVQLADKRTTLENDLIEIKNEISHLDGVLEHLSPLTGTPNDATSLAGLGITDAIRLIFQATEGRMSAKDVRRELEDKGFDLSGLSAPMASIYKVLGRLTDDSNELEREREELSVFYRWKREEDPTIADEDIPF